MIALSDYKLVGRLKGPFSLTGEVRVQFMDIEMADYLIKNKIKLYLVTDQRYLTPKSVRVVPKGIAFRFHEIADRNEAETLSKGELMALTSDLPSINEDNLLLSDLVGFSVISEDNKIYGTVDQAVNYGASDIIECKGIDGKYFSMPLIDSTYIEIDLEQKKIIVTDMINHYLNIS